MPLPTQTFSRRVVKLALSIPPGKVTTYGHLAKAAGSGGMAAQSIGSILGRAEENGVTGIPWHRIVYANGLVWLSDKNRQKRLTLYGQEGIQLDKNDKIINFKEVLVDLSWPDFADLDQD
jgi:methylated-DNA-protein-cysteine methyltransferase-like protein